MEAGKESKAERCKSGQSGRNWIKRVYEVMMYKNPGSGQTAQYSTVREFVMLWRFIQEDRGVEGEDVDARIWYFSISDGLAPHLPFQPPNHLLSWHFNELRDDSPSSVITDEQPLYSKRWVVQLKRAVTRSPGPVHTEWRPADLNSRGRQLLCAVYKRATRNFKVILILETTPGIVISVTCRNLWCPPPLPSM